MSAAPALRSSATSVPGAFRAVVGMHAERPALEADGVSLTYAELDRLSNRVANGLLAQGGEQPIAAVAPLEPSSIVVMLGALKAGRVFAPLDPRDPPDRLRAIRVQLGAAEMGDDLFAELSVESESDPFLPLDPYHPSLVYFTSGSSGQPKGTIKSHEQLALSATAYDLGAGDRFACVIPLCFAASVMPVFGALLSGTTMCLFDPVSQGVDALARWLGREDVTVAMTSPSVLRTVASVLEADNERVRSVRLAIVGGEACRGEDLDVARRAFPRAAMANQLGSSEAGFIAGTIMGPDEDLPRGPIPFRWAFPWQTIEIVDERRRPVRTGEVGEILVRGNAISLGYWDGPEREDQRFFEESGDRSVLTGDRGRLLPDGTLEHLGRADLRVKIHGQTVDLQAVEQALHEVDGVDEAVVSAVPGPHDEVRLVAHIVSNGSPWPKPSDVRLALEAKLPPFMIPAVFVPVDAIPRSDRGKVDREALRLSALTDVEPSAAFVAPRTALEREMATAASDVLGLERVGVGDNLFELGLDSLAIIELLVALRERARVDLSASDLYEEPTIEGLAGRFDAGARSAERLVVPLSTGGSGTPLFLVPGNVDAGMPALRGIAQRLDRPTYAFIPHGLAVRGVPDRTVERAAARFVQALRSAQPAGPYLIGGYSLGALVGYEMACQLQRSGQTVALLVLLDPISHASGPRARVELVAGGQRGDRASSVARARLVARHGRLWFTDGLRAATAGILLRSPARQHRSFFLLGLRMSRRYRPGPYIGPALVLRTARWKALDRLEISERLLVGEKRLVDIPGDHVSALAEPNAGPLAAVLRESLAAADPSL